MGVCHDDDEIVLVQGQRRCDVVVIAQDDIMRFGHARVLGEFGAAIEQCAAASEELSNQAQNLKVLLGNYNLKNNSGISGAEFGNTAGNIAIGSQTAQRADSFGASKNIGTINQSNTIHRIPDASEFAGKSNFNENESIISLEDNGYSKY